MPLPNKVSNKHTIKRKRSVLNSPIPSLKLLWFSFLSLTAYLHQQQDFNKEVAIATEQQKGREVKQSKSGDRTGDDKWKVKDREMCVCYSETIWGGRGETGFPDNGAGL
jgi:hypothetical protein